MYRLLFILIILIQGCATITVGGSGSSVTKIDDESYVLRVVSSGVRSSDAIENEARIQGSRLCLGADIEITQIGTEIDSGMVMAGGMFINTFSDKASVLIKCLGLGHDEFKYVSHGEDIGQLEGYSRVRLFNSSNDILYADNTGYVYVELGSYPVVKLPKNQYLDLIIKNGSQDVKLSHVDVFKFSGKNRIELNGQGVNLQVWASPTSTRSKVVQSLPENFNEKYTPYLVKENITSQARGTP